MTDRQVEGSYIVNCVLGNYLDYPHDAMATEFKVKIDKGDGTTHAIIQLHGSKDFMGDDFFGIISEQVWMCNNEKKATKFLRVVNEFEIVKPVRYIETFDGVDIIHNKELPHKSLKIVEIKYLDAADPFQVVAFGGELKFGNEDFTKVQNTYHKVTTEAVRKSTEETVSLIGRSYDSAALLMNEHDPMIPFSPLDRVFTSLAAHSNEGFTTMDLTATILYSEIEGGAIECEFKPDLKRLPSVQVTSNNPNLEEIMVKSDYFETEVSEVWECQIPNQAKPVLRIVNRQKLKKSCKVNLLKFSPHITKVWNELENNEHVIKMLDIRYLNQSDQQLIYMNTSIFLAERRDEGEWMIGPNMETPPTSIPQTLVNPEKIAVSIFWEVSRKVGLFPKYNQDRFPNHLEKTIYNGGSTRVATFKNGSRLFQIGSMNQGELIDYGHMNCKQHNNSEEIFESRVYIPRVMELIDGEMYLLDKDTLDDAFTISERIVWLCTLGLKKVIRVFTAMCAKDIVTAVRYFDGVQVSEYKMFNDLDPKTTQILETIYFDPQTDYSHKYEGDAFSDTQGPKSGDVYCPVVPPQTQQPKECIVNRVFRGVKKLWNHNEGD